MATTKRGKIVLDMAGMDQEEVENLGNEMVEALTKFEEEQTGMTLAEAIHLVLEPAEFFIADAKEGTIAKSPRFRRAVSYLREFTKGKNIVGHIKNKGEI
jgi:hypothetical protein